MMRPALLWLGLPIWLSLATVAGAAPKSKTVASALGSCRVGTGAETTSIYFAPGTVALDHATVRTISCVAESIKRNPQASVIARIHLNHLGSSSYELAIGQERLAAVRLVLRAAGVTGARIRLEMATDDPNGAECANDECRAQSTRVDLIRQR